MTYFGRNKFKGDYWEQLQMWCVNIAYVIDGMVGILSLGYIRCDIRCWILFDLFEED